jgi:tetratricopeptide (TPR) repeat protein/SAM-dependent methyltransferase
MIPPIYEPNQKKLLLLMQLYKEGKWEQVVSKVKKLRRKFPVSVNLSSLTGASYSKLEKLIPAIVSFKKAVIIQPGNSQVYNNLGSLFQRLPDLDKAKKTLKKAVVTNPLFAEAFFNLGNTFWSNQDHKIAVDHYRYATQHSPNFAEAYNNMGLVFMEMGEPDKAIDSLRKATERRNNYADAHNNLAIALKDKGLFEEAFHQISIAIDINPKSPQAFFNLGELHWKMKKFAPTTQCYIKAVQLDPNFKKAYEALGAALGIIKFSEHNPLYESVLIELLKKKTVVRPLTITGAAISLLKQHPIIQETLKLVRKDHKTSVIGNILHPLSKSSLLTHLIQVSPIPDPDIEEILTRTRHYLLLNYENLKSHQNIINFSSAIASHCFINEYMNNETIEETEKLTILIREVALSLQKGGQPDPLMIISIASYRRLNEFQWINDVKFEGVIEDLGVMQIKEPQQETIIQKEIPTLQEIVDDVSKKVRQQYEENPYPRWVNLRLRTEPLTVSKFLNAYGIRVSDERIFQNPSPEVLIAGCGTGQHAIEASGNLKNSQVMAVDLSSRSLAYAQRKTLEFGIDNIDYLHGDIFDLPLLKRNFDIIESVGVLHHLRNPIDGWRVLVKILKPGGLMRIGLYSQNARRHIERFRDKYSMNKEHVTTSEIRAFRRTILSMSNSDYKKLCQAPDFYTTSSLRDLVFHVQEHRFNTFELDNMLGELGLEFCGFVFDDSRLIDQFEQRFPGIGSKRDLKKWGVFEEENPLVFSAMYQFYCQKIKSI